MNQKKHPTSLKLTTFGDGTASAVLDDESIWIEPHRQIRLGPTGVFYRFDLKPEITTRRESSLELYLSRLSLKLYGKRKDRFEGQVISVKDYNQLQCYKEPVIELFDDP